MQCGGGRIDSAPLPPTLANVRLEWSEPVQLCVHPRAGQALDAAIAAKLDATIPAQSAIALTQDALRSASLGSAILRRGPLAAEQIVATGSAQLVRYEIGERSLAASIEQPLDGGAVLLEQIELTRADGDARNVQPGEVSFAYRASCDAEPIALAPCTPEGAVQLHALAARMGDDYVVLWRRSVGGVATYTSVAASSAYPMSAEGYWSQTLASNGDFTVDLERDLRAHFQYFTRSPEELGSGVVVRVTTNNERQVELTTLDSTTGQRRTRTLPSVNGWVRMDEAALREDLDCEGGLVTGLLSSGSHSFQMSSCPGDGPLGFRVRSLVPIAFWPDVDQLGEVIDESAITLGTLEGAPALNVPVGAYSVMLGLDEQSDIRMQVFDSSGTRVHPRPGLNFDFAYLSSLENDEPFGILTSPDERLGGTSTNVSMVVWRRFLGLGGGLSSVYAPMSLDVRAGDRTFHVDAWDRLNYTNTHHNSTDRLIARTGEVEIECDLGWELSVRVVRIADGAELVPRTVLNRDPTTPPAGG